MKHLKKLTYLLLTITLLVSCEKETDALPEIFNESTEVKKDTKVIMNEKLERLIQNNLSMIEDV